MRLDLNSVVTMVGFATLVTSSVTLAAETSPGAASPLNDMPYGKLKEMAAKGDMMSSMQSMMKQGVFLMGGQPTKTAKSNDVSLVGEIVDANCYTANGYRGHNHALCAKACVLNGSSLTFVTTNGQAYPIVSHADFVPIAQDVYDAIGSEGLKVAGYVNERGGVRALTLTSIDGKAIETKKTAM